MALDYNAAAWFWIVGGNAAQVYSSAAGNYVPVADAGYMAWLDAGNAPTIIDTEENLGDVLGTARARPPAPPAMLVAYEEALLMDMGFATFVGLFDHENRLRAFEGAPPLTLGEYEAHLKSQLKEGKQ